MPYTLSIDAANGILEVRGEGTFTRADFDRLIAEGLPILVAHGIRRVLSDYRNAELALSIGELHQVVRAISEAIAAGGIPHTDVKRALVFTRDAESYRFYETAARNRNQFFRLFRDVDDARRWLVGPDE